MNTNYVWSSPQLNPIEVLDRVYMSQRNGELVIARPLYLKTQLNQDIDFTVGQSNAYIVNVTNEQVIGYALFHNDELLYMLTPEHLKALPLEDLGEL